MKRHSPRPATIIEGVIPAHRLIVTPLDERVVIELHTSDGERFRVVFVEIEIGNARDLAAALVTYAEAAEARAAAESST